MRAVQAMGFSRRRFVAMAGAAALAATDLLSQSHVRRCSLQSLNL